MIAVLLALLLALLLVACVAHWARTHGGLTADDVFVLVMIGAIVLYLAGLILIRVRLNARIAEVLG